MTQLLIDRATLEQIVRMLEQCLDDAIQVQCDLEQGYSKSLALAQMVQVELSKEALSAGRAALANAERAGPEDGCAPNHMCNGHRVHIPTGECCNKCGATSW